MKNQVLFIFSLILFVVACNTGPSSPDFLITAVEFSGDSTGNSSRTRVVMSVPYCEFTIEWEDISPEISHEYSVFRSLNSDIQGNPGAALKLTSLYDNTWVDSEGLEWDTDYFYAVKAVPTQGENKWSNEVQVHTPVSPYPVPPELNYEKDLFHICSLSWEAFTDSDIQTAFLLRSSYPDIESSLYPRDTLIVVTDFGSGQFADSIIDRDSRFYTLAVSGGDDLVSYGNEICFTPGGEIPWFVDGISSFNNCLAVPWESEHGLLSSDCQRIYFSYENEDYPQNSISVLGANTGSIINSLVTIYRNICFTERADGSILAILYHYSTGYHLAHLSQNLDTVIQLFDFSMPLGAVIEVPAGVLCSSENETLVLDPVTFQIVDSLSFSFTRAVTCGDLNRTFLLTGSGVRCLRSTDLSYLGSISGSYSRIQKGLDGNLYCFEDDQVEWYSAGNLAYQGSFLLPTNTFGAIVLPGKEHILYAFNWEGIGATERLDAYDMRSGDHIGRVIGTPSSSERFPGLYPSWYGDFVWVIQTNFGTAEVYYYRVTL